MMELPKSAGSLLIRTFFNNSQAWSRLREAALAENLEGFVAYLSVVDNPTNDAASWREIIAALQDSESVVAFIADQEAHEREDFPVLVVDLRDGRAPFRCIATELWGVENNLAIANMDWEEFAEHIDAKGVFRGFPDETPR